MYECRPKHAYKYADQRYRDIAGPKEKRKIKNLTYNYVEWRDRLTYERANPNKFIVIFFGALMERSHQNLFYSMFSV